MISVEILSLIIAIAVIGFIAIFATIIYSTYAQSVIKEVNSGDKDIELIDEAIYENLSRVKIRRKIIGTIKSVLFYGLMIFIIPFFVFSIINKFQGNITTIGNKGVLVVASGSMSEKHPENTYLVSEGLDNQFNKFDIIVIQKVDSDDDLKLYDVISFINDEGTTIIHRIVDITTNDDGIVEYTTRGDSNGLDGVDKYRPTINDIQGKYTGDRVSNIGMFILFMQSPLGIVTIVGLLYCLIMIDRKTSKIALEQQKRLSRLNEFIDYGNNLEPNCVEKIYYKECVYTFNKEGFLEKEEISDEVLLEKTNESILKVIINTETNDSITEEYQIEKNESEED